MFETEKQLLEVAKQIIDKYNLIDTITGKNFNILSTGNVDKEEKFHQLLIADLLDPNGSHNQGDKFLNLFLKEIDMNDLKNPSVYIEYVIDDKKRIDIVIEDNENIIAIEMKIDSKDHVNQLKNYYNFIKNKNKKSKLYYLTLFGEEPSDESNQNVECELLSFKENISNWLEECIKEVYNIPNIRDSLLIYKDLIDKLTNNDNLKKEKEMAEILAKDPKTIEVATNIYQGLERAWAEKEYEFWRELKDNILNKASKLNYNFYYFENDDLLEEIEFNKEDIIEIIHKIRFSNNKYKSFGISFEKELNNYYIYISIGYTNQDSYLWIAIGLCNDDNCFSSDEIKKFFQGEDFNLKKSDDYSIYKEINNLKFASKNDLYGTFELFDENKCKKIIDELADQMIDLIKKIDEKIKLLK
jgi:hypothetical protein